MACQLPKILHIYSYISCERALLGATFEGDKGGDSSSATGAGEGKGALAESLKLR